jgi:quercetin dioxygenase-like cupin family protein
MDREEPAMKRLLSAFCLALLLSGLLQAQDSSGVTASVLAKSDSSWDGTPLPNYPEKKPEITILRITIPPGVALPLHEHPVINAGVLLSGELTVVTEDERTLHLKAGDAIVEVVNKWHYGKSTGNVPAVILVFYAGAVDVPITVKK